MKEKKQKFIDWVKQNKGKIIITGIGTTATIAVILGIKNYMEIETLRGVVPDGNGERKTALDLTVVDNSEYKINVEDLNVGVERLSKVPHYVCQHTRNLPEGWSPSAEKMAEAIELGLDLAPNQTLVDEYFTGGTAA